MRKRLGTFIWLGWLLVRVVTPCPAAVTITGRMFDGEASLRVALESRQRGENFDPALMVPLASREVSILLYEGLNSEKPATTPSKTWKTTTDAAGAFGLETGLEQWPPGGFLVARSELGGHPVYSAFLNPSTGALDVNLYPSSDNAQQLTVKAQVSYDVFGTGAQKSIRVRFGLRVENQSGTLYVGQPSASGAREIWRIPLPKDAKILVNTGPYKDMPGWRTSQDGQFLILNTPIASVLDFELQKDPWEVHYVVPASQRFVQSFPVPVTLDKQSFLVWCTHEAMSLDSPQLKGRHSAVLPDPFTREERNQDVIFSTDRMMAGTQAIVVLDVDNVALGQRVSLRAVKWVGGFVLVCILSILLGLALGPREPTADALLASFTGEEILDRIALIDLRRSRGEIGEQEHQRLREPLVELAMEESPGGPPAAPSSPSPLSPESFSSLRPILDQIDKLEKGGLRDPALIAERAHLLEALAKELKNQGERG